VAERARLEDQYADVRDSTSAHNEDNCGVGCLSVARSQIVVLVTLSVAVACAAIPVAPLRSAAQFPSLDARIEIVYPHDGFGNEAPASTAPFVSGADSRLQTSDSREGLSGFLMAPVRPMCLICSALSKGFTLSSLQKVDVPLDGDQPGSHIGVSLND